MAHGKDGLLGVVMEGSVPFLAGFMEWQGYKHRVHQGANPLFAGAVGLGRFAAQVLMNQATFGLLDVGPQVIRMAGMMATQKVIGDNALTRQMRTPFSHRFEHTQASAMMQQNSLSAIGAAWGHAAMGSEAARFASRYGRSSSAAG